MKFTVDIDLDAEALGQPREVLADRLQDLLGFGYDAHDTDLEITWIGAVCGVEAEGYGIVAEEDLPGWLRRRA